jgi:hypothetical protein
MGGGVRSKSDAASSAAMPGMDESMGSMRSGGMAMASAAPGLPALLRLDADIARAVAEREGTGARLQGELVVLALFVGEEAAEAVRAQPDRFLAEGAVGSSPEQALAAIDEQAAAADVEVARTARRPDVMIEVAERVMPEGMLAGTDVSLGVAVPLWGGRGRTLEAARASEAAAGARADAVDRDLASARAEAASALASAESRLAALEGVAVPRARAAWEIAQRLFASNQATAEEVVLAWEGRIAVEREAVQARRDRALRAAEALRLEGR